MRGCKAERETLNGTEGPSLDDGHSGGDADEHFAVEDDTWQQPFFVCRCHKVRASSSHKRRVKIADSEDF